MARREWIGEHRAWTIDAFTKSDVYDPSADPIARLQAGFASARRTISLWTPRRRT